jgi:hypothetical protein
VGLFLFLALLFPFFVLFFLAKNTRFLQQKQILLKATFFLFIVAVGKYSKDGSGSRTKFQEWDLNVLL